jgi:site-specific recombinase XerD
LASSIIAPPPTSAAAYDNLMNSCKSPATRIGYSKALRYFLAHLKMEPGSYDKLLERPISTIENDVRDFILSLRKEHSSATVSLYVAGVRKFFDMNRVTLNWKWIRSFEGEREKQIEDRPYTLPEIRMLVDRASLRNKAVILTMFSSAVRVGALPHMRLRDLEPIDKYDIYKITVYPKSRKSKYATFCTPECRKAIDSYIEWRKRFGEKVTKDSPLFRISFNVEGPNVKNPNPISRAIIIKAINKLLKHCGLRPQIPLESHRHVRYDIMGSHGFRKAFEKQAYSGGMDREYIRRLLGQKGGSNALEDSYLKMEAQELLEGDSKHVGYVGVIDALTIDETHRLQSEVKELRIRADKADAALERIMRLEQRFGIG